MEAALFKRWMHEGVAETWILFPSPVLERKESTPGPDLPWKETGHGQGLGLREGCWSWRLWPNREAIPSSAEVRRTGGSQHAGLSAELSHRYTWIFPNSNAESHLPPSSWPSSTLSNPPWLPKAPCRLPPAPHAGPRLHDDVPWP